MQTRAVERRRQSGVWVIIFCNNLMIQICEFLYLMREFIVDLCTISSVDYAKDGLWAV